MHYSVEAWLTQDARTTYTARGGMRACCAFIGPSLNARPPEIRFSRATQTIAALRTFDSRGGPRGDRSRRGALGSLRFAKSAHLSRRHAIFLCSPGALLRGDCWNLQESVDRGHVGVLDVLRVFCLNGESDFIFYRV